MHQVAKLTWLFDHLGGDREASSSGKITVLQITVTKSDFLSHTRLLYVQDVGFRAQWPKKELHESVIVLVYM